MTTQHRIQIDQPQTYRADIVVPATEDSPARLVHVQLDAEETERLQRIASECAWSVDTLVRKHVSEGLPRHVEFLCGVDLRRDEEYTAPTLREQRGEVPRYRQLSPGHEQTWTAKVPLVDWQPPTTGGEVHFDPKLSLLTPTLDVEATTAVVRYHHATGDSLDDIVSGVVLDQVGRALAYVADRRHDEWQRTTRVVSPTLPRDGTNTNPPIRRMDSPASRIRSSLACRRLAHTMMRAVALHRGQGSVETLVRELCMTECKLFAEAILNPGQTTLDGLF